MKNKGVTIAALIIAIIGLSIGFAAFSNTLTIRSSASVNPTNTMRVVFSKSSSGEVTGAVNSVLPDNSTYGDGATIDNSASQNSVLKDIHAKFTAPNQTVKYNTDLYVVNVGNYQAQLTGVTFKNITGESVFKKCTAVTTNKQESEIATDSLVQQACNGISISVKIGNKVATPSDTSLNYQILNVGASLPVEVTITYANGSAYADGDFEVEFGDIEISATSAVDNSLVVTPQEPLVPEVDNLIPTAEELADAYYDEDDDMYRFIGEQLIYMDNTDGKVLSFASQDGAGYFYFLDSTAASIYSSLVDSNLQTNKWYYTEDYESMELYTGPSPISLSDFNSEDIKSESYLNRVIASFNTN